MNKKMMAMMVMAIAIAVTEAKAQNLKIVKGNVFINEQQPATFVNIHCFFYDAFLQTIQSDSSGHFIFFNTHPGKYRMQLSMVGHKQSEVSFTIDSLSADTITLLPVVLIPSVKMLDEVKVTGKKSLIEYKLDRTVINTDALISGAGLNALELLERTPGVIVDANGNISMSGKTGVLVMVDGKPSYLSGEQLATYLKSLPVSALERIELMTNPSAKYDAAGGAGLIDIRTKKSRVKGFFGSVGLNAGTSRLFRNSGNLNFNYYEGKINLFGNVGYSNVKSHRILQLERAYYDNTNQLITRYVQTSDSRPTNKSTVIKLGADYFVSSRTTIGAVFNGSFAPGSFTNPVTAFLYNSQASLDSTITANNTATNQFNNVTANFNILHRLDSNGTTLSADLDWVNYKASNKQKFLNSTLYSTGMLKSSETVTADLPVAITIRTAKTDYSKNLRRNQKLELGVKSSFVTALNTSCYYNWLNNEPVVDNRNTNQFQYEETIHAGYINFSRELKRLSFQTGLRFENTDINAKQFGNPVKSDSAFHQQYTNIFPTVYISYKLDSVGSHLLNASYGRRIDRPYYKDLNPFIYIVDRYTWFSGNPLLQPQFSSNYNLTYRYKAKFSASLFYYNYSRYQTETVFEEGGIFISRPANIGKRIYQGINATASITLNKWWRNNLYTEVVNMKFNGAVNNTVINSNSTYFYVESGNQFDLGKTLAIELTGFYMTRRAAAQFNLDPKGQLSIGVQKRFWKNKASFRCAVSDIFQTNISGGTVNNITHVTSHYRNDTDTRMMNFGLSFNFGNVGKAPKSRSTGSSQVEQNRVKN